MIGYLIDTPKREIREVEYNDTLEELYKLIGFECGEVRGIMLNGQRDTLYIDANALDTAQTRMDLRKYLFSHKRYHSTLIGRGIILGIDEFGDVGDRPFSSIETYKQEITFYV